MKKIIKYTILISFMIGIGFIAYIILSSGEDNGERKPINAIEVKWKTLSEDDVVYGVQNIIIDNEKINNIDYYNELIETFHENNLSNEPKKGYVKVYVKFTNIGYLQESETRTKYEGKDTVFYIKETAVERVVKANKEDILETEKEEEFNSLD